MKRFLFPTLFAVVLFAVTTTAQDSIDKSVFAQTANGQTVLLGTFMWNAELDNFPRNRTAEGKATVDIWWEQQHRLQQQIAPQNKAVIAEVTDKDFADLTVEDLKALTYTKNPVSNEKLVPNAVIALRTTEGNYVKIKVIGYRPLQDFSFKEAAILDDCWKKMVLSKPDREKYHLEIEWVLYTKQ